VATGQKEDTNKKADDPKGGSFNITSTNSGKTGVETTTALKEDLGKTEQPVVVTADEVKPDAKIASPVIQKNDQKSIALDKQEENRKAEDKYANKKDLERVEVTGLGTKRSGPNRQQLTNNFRGRVTDPNNNPVPFASITNTRDKDATYSDANGYFNVASRDTVVDIQVRSVGFEIYNARLRDIKENQVILRDDRSSMSEVVINTPKPNTSRRSVFEKKKSEEPEPEDGWENYDVYLINNLQLPDEIKTRNMNGQVEVSFEVNKYGQPVNFKIVKSLCNKCDEEAIRLIKQGPKWERTRKKARAIVAVPFTSNKQ
jgi:outer membrane biosynthesis protein TonB